MPTNHCPAVKFVVEKTASPDSCNSTISRSTHPERCHSTRGAALKQQTFRRTGKDSQSPGVVSTEPSYLCSQLAVSRNRLAEASLP